jgi:hypothetical protein
MVACSMLRVLSSKAVMYIKNITSDSWYSSNLVQHKEFHDRKFNIFFQSSLSATLFIIRLRFARTERRYLLRKSRLTIAPSIQPGDSK